MPATHPPASELHPALLLGASLALLALFVLPAFSGGYSGAGYQVGFVILPVAAALCWAVCSRRPHAAAAVVLLVLLGGMGMLWWLQPGRDLWFYLLHIPCAWIAVWVMGQAAGLPDSGRGGACPAHNAGDPWVAPTQVTGEPPAPLIRARAGLLLPALCGGALLAALYGWWMWLGAGRPDYQLTGTFGLHNAFAGYLLLAWPAAAYAALAPNIAGTAPRHAWRWFYIGCAYFFVLTLLLTYSRAAWIALLLQLLFLGGGLAWRRFFAGRRGERALGYGLAGMAVMALALLAFSPVRSVLMRLLDFQGYSMQGRLRYWSAALEIFRDHPLGVGPGAFAYIYPQYQRDWMYYSVDPHSWPLQLLCELGLGGALILLAILAGYALWVRRLHRATGGSPTALLLIAATSGSLLHAAVDFDYTFGATTALLGALLALGSLQSEHANVVGAAHEPPLHEPPRQGIQPGNLRRRVCVTLTVALLLAYAVIGEALTAERYILDRLRDAPGLPLENKSALLTQAVRYNPYNFKTRYQLASLQAQSATDAAREQALDNVQRCLRLNPRYAKAWALQALLARPPAAGNADMQHALDLDPYNFPEHYFYWANLAADDAEKRRRLELGLERIPAHDPITPEHIRPTWHELNPLFAQWYLELARLTEDEQLKELYLNRGARFKAYWEGVLKQRGLSTASAAEDEAGA